jgi:hypothetical protein
MSNPEGSGPRSAPLNAVGIALVTVIVSLMGLGLVCCFLALIDGSIGPALFFGLMTLALGAYLYLRLLSIPALRKPQ